MIKLTPFLLVQFFRQTLHQPLTLEHVYFIPLKLHIFSFFYTIITLERDLPCGMRGQTKNSTSSRKRKLCDTIYDAR